MFTPIIKHGILATQLILLTGCASDPYYRSPLAFYPVPCETEGPSQGQTPLRSDNVPASAQDNRSGARSTSVEPTGPCLAATQAPDGYYADARHAWRYPYRSPYYDPYYAPYYGYYNPLPYGAFGFGLYGGHHGHHGGHYQGSHDAGHGWNGHGIGHGQGGHGAGHGWGGHGGLGSGHHGGH